MGLALYLPRVRSSDLLGEGLVTKTATTVSWLQWVLLQTLRRVPPA
jgi:hypothetical protein